MMELPLKDKVARMKATSVLDTIAVDMTIISADQRKLVPIGVARVVFTAAG